MMIGFTIQVVQGHISSWYHCFSCELHKELHNTTTKWGAIKVLYFSTGFHIFFIEFIHSSKSTKDDMKILREYHFYISSHSIKFLHGFYQLFYGDLANKGMSYLQHIIWLDNCASQFNNARMFYWLSKMHKLCRSQYMWNFTVASHENTENDGASMCIKRALAYKELK